MPKLRPRVTRSKAALDWPGSHPAPEKITSTANPRIRLLKSLHSKKGRNDSSLFLAEGARLLMEAAGAGHWPELVAFTDEAGARPAQREYLLAARRNGARLISVPSRLLTSICQRDNPQALIGAFRQWQTEIGDLPDREGALLLALHEIRDPGNLGAIIRTADAVGVDGVVLLGECVDPFSIEAVRASMGALFTVRVLRAGFAEFDHWRRARGIRLVAGTLRGTDLPEIVDYRGSIALLMGNEQKGLPEAMEAQVDYPVRIPMRGKADSLNLAVATGVLLYTAWRGRHYAET